MLKKEKYMSKIEEFAKEAADSFVEILTEHNYDGKKFSDVIFIATDYFRDNHLNFTMDYPFEQKGEERYFASNEDKIYSYLQKLKDDDKCDDFLDQLCLKTISYVKKHYGIKEDKEIDFAKELDAQKILAGLPENNNRHVFYTVFKCKKGNHDVYCEYESSLRSIEKYEKDKAEIKLPIEVCFDPEKKSSKFCDLMDGFFFCASKRFAAFVKHLQKDMKTLPVVFKNKAGEVISEDLCIILFPEYDLLDEEASSFEVEHRINYNNEPIELYDIHEFVFDEKKLQKVPKENNFFHPKHSVNICCTEYAKIALEKAFKQNPPYIPDTYLFNFPVADKEYYEKIKRSDESAVELISMITGNKNLALQMETACKDIAKFVNENKIPVNASSWHECKNPGNHEREFRKRDCICWMLKNNVEELHKYWSNEGTIKILSEYADTHNLDKNKLMELLLNMGYDEYKKE